MRTINLAFILVVIAACKSSEPPAAKPPGKSGSATRPALDPWAAFDAMPETSETRKARAEAAIARVSAIEPKLAELRHLSLDKPIPALYQTKEDFRAFVHREVDKERTHDREVSAALVQLGLLPAGVDLATAEEHAFATQAAAYYDPAQQKFFLVMVPDAPAMLDIVSAHELTHGLQDQHFDLKKYFGEDATGTSKLDDDVQTARRFVVEGDATFTMMLYGIGDMNGHKEPTGGMKKLLRMQIALAAGTDTNAMIDSMAQQTGLGSGDFAESMNAMRDIPRTVLVPMFDSYTLGAQLVLAAYEHGGWPAVDALYTDPPESTEQVLHPETRLYPRRDHPIRVTLPKLPGGTEVTSNVLGELQWQIYFSQWKHDGDSHVSENWGGDRYAVVKDKDGKLVGLVATVWDTPYDAQLFARAYRSTIDARTKAAGHTGKILVKADDRKVLIVDGGDEAMLAALATGATFGR